MDEVEFRIIQSRLDEAVFEAINTLVNSKVIAQGRSKTLTERFKKGLENEGIPLEDIDNGTWKYAGGDRREHVRYFRQCSFKIPAPPHKEWCICGQKIDHNCFITNLKRLVVIGNCCIKKFLAKCGRTCELCGEPHKHRIGNLCKACRVGRCWICGDTVKKQYKRCLPCKRAGYNDNGDRYKEERLRVERVERIDKEMEECFKREMSDSESKSTSESERVYIKTCMDCDKPIDKKYTKCWSCNQSKPSQKDHSGICITCDKSIDCKYIRCYTCNKNR